MAKEPKSMTKVQSRPSVSLAPASANAEQEKAGVPAGGVAGESKGFAAICYLLGIFIAILIFLLKKKEDSFIRYHAAQAILFDLCITIVSMVLGVVLFIILIAAGILTLGFGLLVGFLGIWLVFLVYGLVILAFRIFFAWKAYHGERFKLPILGNEAEKISR